MAFANDDCTPGPGPAKTRSLTEVTLSAWTRTLHSCREPWRPSAVIKRCKQTHVLQRKAADVGRSLTELVLPVRIQFSGGQRQGLGGSMLIELGLEVLAFATESLFRGCTLVITLAGNTLAATTHAWDDAVGQPTTRKDRVQDTEDTLTPDLVDDLVNLISPPEQHNQKSEGPKVTYCMILDKPPDAPTVTLTCHQHTGGLHNGTPQAQRTESTHSHQKREQQPQWHWGTVLATPPTTPTTP